MPITVQDLIKHAMLGGGSGGSGGGGSAGVQPKEVNFYDYDGVCLYAYTVAEAQALSELPAGPEHPGLVFQGWNWSLEGVKGLTRAMNIGAMYTTDDGTTRLYITLQEGHTSPMLGVGVNGTVTVDWGDGTEPDVLTGTSTSTTKWTPNHTYAAPGDYVIRLTVAGQVGFTGSTSTNQGASILRQSSGNNIKNATYRYTLYKAEIGNNVVGFYEGAFYRCGNLKTVTLPNSVVTINHSVFSNCISLVSLTVPSSATAVYNALAKGCTSLTIVALPDAFTNFGNEVFSACRNLRTLAFPDGVTTISQYATQGCYLLSKVSMPKNLETVSAYAFADCPGVSFYDFTFCTAVPTLSSASAFSNIIGDCEIRVPAALYDEWIAATNWATCASYIKAY